MFTKFEECIFLELDSTQPRSVIFLIYFWHKVGFLILDYVFEFKFFESCKCFCLMLLCSIALFPLDLNCVHMKL